MVLVLLLALTLGIPPALGGIAALVFRGKGHPDRARAAVQATAVYVVGTLAYAVAVFVRVALITEDWALSIALLGPVLQFVANLLWLRATTRPAVGAAVYGLGFVVPLVPAVVWSMTSWQSPATGALEVAIGVSLLVGTGWIGGGGAVLALASAFLAERTFDAEDEG